MATIFEKFKFTLRKPKVVVITGEDRTSAKETIFQVLKNKFKIGKEVLIFETEDKNIKKFEFYLKNSEVPILVISRVGDIPYDEIFFAGEREKISQSFNLAKTLPVQSYLVLNYDDETVREIADFTNIKTFTFGFNERADFFASDIKLNHGTNFKVNYQGKVVPFWLEKTFGKEQIYSALASTAVGTILGLNLVEISQTLKNYQSLPGKMRLIEGIKNSWILDDSESATVFSMIEALEILGKLEKFKRKIAVLGDVVGIGKYTIEAHQTIGEWVAKNADLLFTFGSRAKFIGKGAFEKGMKSERIFQFETIEEGKSKLQDEIKEGDLILVDGSKEIKMEKIVGEIRKIW